MTHHSINLLDPPTSPDAPRAPLRPEKPRYRLITTAATPDIHRANLLALATSGNKRGLRENVDPYRLVHQYLQKERGILKKDADELMAELKKTNRLLQTLIYGGVGFALGLALMQLLVRSGLI